jgi:YVTN family beta-propeller protein
VIDGQTNSVITTISAGSAPYALCWNSINNKVYCANNFSASVSVIDGANNSVLTTIPVGDYPCAFCWNSTQNRVYVANGDTNYISVIRDSIISGIEENHQPLATDRFLLEVFPNPAKSLSIIHYSSHTENKLSLLLYDISGRLVKILVNEQKEQGNYSINLNTKTLSAGIYFLSLATKKQRIIERLVVIK